MTFDSLYKLKNTYCKVADVDLGKILKHELLPVPISIADTSGSLKSENKAVILNDVLRGVEVGVRMGNADD